MTWSERGETHVHNAWDGCLSRRQLLRRAAVIGLTPPIIGGLLAACGGDDTDSDSPETEAADEPTQVNSQGDATQPPTIGSTPTIATENDTPSAGGTLTVAITQDLVSPDPHIAGGHSDFNILRHLYEGLLTLDDAADIIPMLAEEWEISDDGLQYTFNLRQGVPFHDGTEMTAADAKYSLDRFRTESTRKGDLVSVEAVEAPDNHTIILTLSTADATILAMLANPYVVAIIPSDSVATEERIQDPIGTGPFTFQEWVQNSRLVFGRFDDYKPIDIPTTGLGGEKQALVDELVIRVIADNQATIAGLQTGELDFAVQIPAQDADRLRETEQTIDILQGPGTFAAVMYFNLSTSPMSDQRFRQAVLSAIDKQAFLEAVYWGHGEPTPYSFIPEQSVWFNEDHATDPFPYNPDTARSLLEEMGYAGEPITISSGNPEQETQAIALQAQLSEVGIVSEVQNLERAAYSELLRNGNFNILSSGTPLRIDPDQRYSFWHCTRSAFVFDYCNPEYDKLIDEARTSIDFEQRKANYGQAALILKEEAIVAPVYFKDVLYAASNHVQGFRINPYDWWQFTNVSVTSD